MLSKQYMSATSHIESSLWIEYSWLQITRTSRQLEVIFASLQIISMSLKKKTVYWNPKHCIRFNWKQPCQFFVRLYFLSLQFKFIVHSPVSYQALLLLKFLVHSINLYFLLPLKWSMHDTCVPSPSICLFPVICFDLTITRTFFGFHRRFELSGVDCSFKWSKSIIGSNTDGNKTKKIHF